MNDIIKRKRKDKFIRLMFVLPAVIIFTLIVVIPVVTAIPFSFFKLKAFIPDQFVGFKYYTAMFGDKLFWNALRNTVVYTLLNSIIIIAFALLLSICLYFLASKRLKGYKVFRSVFLAPICLSGSVVGLMWQFIYHPKIGLLNGILSLTGLDRLTQAWLTNDKYILLILIIPAVWQWVGFYVILLFTSIMNVPNELTEAAMIDGAGKFKMITTIIIPLIIPTLEYVCILALSGAAKAFDLIWIMTQGGPGSASETISLYMYRQAFGWGNFEYGTAIGISLFVVCGMFTLINRGIFQKINWDK